MATLPRDPRLIWPPGEPTVSTAREAKHALVREVKQLIEAVHLLDVETAGEAKLSAAAERVAEIAGEVADLPSLRERGGPVYAGPDDAVLAERSGISGYGNPLAPPVVMAPEGDRMVGTAVYTAAYEGPPGCLHGGFVAAAFDDLMGLAQMVTGTAGYTGTLTVRMIRPTPLNREIRYEAWLDRHEGRKIWVKARSSTDDEVLAEAEILFITPRSGPVVPTG